MMHGFNQSSKSSFLKASILCEIIFGSIAKTSPKTKLFKYKNIHFQIIVKNNVQISRFYSENLFCIAFYLVVDNEVKKTGLFSHENQ